ncbi:hypothetical protein Hanom_Chr11g01020771 [Helianthus anomalus]
MQTCAGEGFRCNVDSRNLARPPTRKHPMFNPIISSNPPTKPTSMIINFSSFKVAHNMFVELSKRVGLVHVDQILCSFSSLYIKKIPHFKNIVTIVCYGGFMVQFSVAI